MRTLNNKVNLLVVEIDLLNVIEKYHINSLINLNLEHRDNKNTALESLQKFGVIKPINDAIGEELYIKYFDDYSYSEDLNNEYKVLFLDSYLEKNIKSNVSENIKSLLGEESIVGIKEIQKTEYRIYGY